MLTYYQKSEIIIGTILYMLFFSVYLMLQGGFAMTKMIFGTVFFILFYTLSIICINMYYDYRVQREQRL